MVEKTNFKFVFIKFGIVDQLCTYKPDRPDGRCHDLITLMSTKGQLNSEWIYEVIVSLKMPTKNYQDFCPTL
jgi:hypothetical protein